MFYGVLLKYFDGAYGGKPHHEAGTVFKYTNDSYGKAFDIGECISGHDLYEQGQGTLMPLEYFAKVSEEDYLKAKSAKDEPVGKIIQAYKDNSFGCMSSQVGKLCKVLQEVIDEECK